MATTRQPVAVSRVRSSSSLLVRHASAASLDCTKLVTLPGRPTPMWPSHCSSDVNLASASPSAAGDALLSSVWKPPARNSPLRVSMGAPRIPSPAPA
jgi:hypothetical protein